MTYTSGLFLLTIGQRTTPSVVAFAEDGTRHVGDVAKRQVSHPYQERDSPLRESSRNYRSSISARKKESRQEASVTLALFSLLSKTNSLTFLLYIRPYKTQNILFSPLSV